MDKKKIFDLLVQTIAEVKSIDTTQLKHIKMNTELDEVGLESIQALQLIEKMKKRYNLENATVSDFYECDTIGDIVEIVEQYSQNDKANH